MVLEILGEATSNPAPLLGGTDRRDGRSARTGGAGQDETEVADLYRLFSMFDESQGFFFKSMFDIIWELSRDGGRLVRDIFRSNFRLGSDLEDPTSSPKAQIVTAQTPISGNVYFDASLNRES